MIRQLRPFYTAEERAEVYARPYDHTRWQDHVIRVQTTIHVARWMRDLVGAKTGADFSAGDGAILRGCSLESSWYGDLTIPPERERHGEVWIDGADLEDDHLWEWQETSVDLYVCSETIEHVRDPRRLLRNIRQSAKALVLSTPEGEEGDGNPEHYWGWDREDIFDLLHETGWSPQICTILDPVVPGGYVYQIWGCL